MIIWSGNENTVRSPKGEILKTQITNNTKSPTNTIDPMCKIKPVVQVDGWLINDDMMIYILNNM